MGGATVLETIMDGLIFAYIVFCGYAGEILIGNYADAAVKGEMTLRPYEAIAVRR